MLEIDGWLQIQGWGRGVAALFPRSLHGHSNMSRFQEDSPFNKNSMYARTSGPLLSFNPGSIHYFLSN